MELQRLIVSLARQDMAGLIRQRLNVVAKLESSPSVELRALRDAIDNEIVQRLDHRQSGWSSGVQGEPRYLFDEGEMVAVVYRTETHGVDRGRYAIEVRGVARDFLPRHVDDARSYAEGEVNRIEAK